MELELIQTPGIHRNPDFPEDFPSQAGQGEKNPGKMGKSHFSQRAEGQEWTGKNWEKKPGAAFSGGKKKKNPEIAEIKNPNVASRFPWEFPT